jgi:hypothetical protein
LFFDNEVFELGFEVGTAERATMEKWKIDADVKAWKLLFR